MSTTHHRRLYARLLGDVWDELDDAVRGLHEENMVVKAEGVFRVSHGSNPLTRLLARFSPMPRAGQAVKVHLTIIPNGEHEEWRRLFDGKPFVSRQWAGAEGLLYEQIGRNLLRMRLEVIDGALHYTSVSAAVCLGRLRIPVPRWMAVNVRARETPIRGNGDETPQASICVQVAAPLLGQLACYEGDIRVVP